MPFIRAISDTSPTSKLNVTFLRTCATERRPQPRTTDSGVQLPQCRYLRDVGGKHPREAILAKQPAGPPSVPSGGSTNRPSMGNVQIGDGRHRGNKGGKLARQRIPCEVPAAPPAANAVQRHSRDTGLRVGVREGVLCVLCSLGSGTRLPVVAKAAARYSWEHASAPRTVQGTTCTWARRVAHNTILRGRTSMTVGAAS